VAGFFRRLGLSRGIGIDLGTANTLVYVSGKGIVLEEPSVVAIDQDRNLVAVGKEAQKMLGRTPVHVTALRPLRDGVIADFYSCEIMLAEFIKRALDGTIGNPRMVIGVPSGITGVERRAVVDAAKNAGSREVGLIDEPVAAALGAGLPVSEATGNMIIDIGGGTTEVAILSLDGTVISESVRVAGDELTEAIIAYLKKVHNLIIGERTAEDIKIRLGSAYPSPEDEFPPLEVRGLHLMSGLPRTVTIKAEEVRESMDEPLSVIVDAIKRTLEKTPPELAADIIDCGIMLAGGGALLRGLDRLVSHETGIVTHVAEEPWLCVVKGTGEVLKNQKLFERIVNETTRNV